jgi:hypothetical protein
MSQKDSPGAQRESDEGECDDKGDGGAKTGQGRREGEPRARRCVLRGDTACVGKAEGQRHAFWKISPPFSTAQPRRTAQWCTRASEEARPPVLMLQAARCRPRQYNPTTAQQQSQTARRKLTRHGCTVASGAPVQSNPAPGGERRRLRGSHAAKSWAEMKAAPQGHDSPDGQMQLG